MIKRTKTLKRLLATGMAAIMTAGMLTGCGGGSSNSTDSSSGQESSGTESADAKGGEAAAGELDTSKEVALSMYVISDRPAGQDVVDENLNKILKEKLNCTLKINYIGWAEYANKYPLLFSSGEEFDMAYAASWLNYPSLAQKGAFMNLDELWPTYAPDNFAAAPEAAKEQATVAGHYYCVPQQFATTNAYGAIYRKDLVEGSDWDGVMETFEDIEEYCDIVKELHPEIEPLDQYSAAPEWSLTYMIHQGYNALAEGIRYLWYDPTEENPKVVANESYEKTPEFLEMMARWNEKGFFTKSALSDTDSQKFQNGKAALRVHNIDTYRGQAILHPDWGVSYSNFVKNLSHLPYTQDCMVISNTSKNPERAMALWNLITTDQEVYDAFMYGVLDVTYTLQDDQFDITDKDLYSEGAMWAARTNELNRNPVGTPEEFDIMKGEFEKTIAANNTAEKYSAFVFDTSTVETELAACNNVWQQYWWPLELAYTDRETGLAEYAEKMKAAGLDKIMEEAQRQLDEYTASH